MKGQTNLAGMSLFCAILIVPLMAKDKVLVPDLSRVTTGREWTVSDRKATSMETDGKKCVRLDERPGYGTARLNGYEFSDGAIEFDARGKNVDQHSFLGAAFHGADEKTYDAVYFRPFNFRSDNAVRKAHAVQYVSHPDYPWKVLREAHPGAYENSVQPPPDPDAWFHVMIVLNGSKVSVFVNGAKQPCLAVESISKRKSGWVGFWVGDDSGGDFRNLRISPAE
jgi:hypothetical protein